MPCPGWMVGVLPRRVRQTKTDTLFMAQIWKSNVFKQWKSNVSKQCFSPKYFIFSNDIFLTILLLIVMSWMRGEQYTSLFYYIIIKNTHTCTSQVFIIMPVGVKKITLPFIFLPSLISQPEWQLSRIGEEKERKKYTKGDGTVQVLS